MANFYTDNENLKFQLKHPLMEKIVRLKENDYILKSTRTWKEALKQADYSLTFDKSIQIESFSLKPDSLKNGVYYWTEKDFYPNDDFIVRIK